MVSSHIFRLGKIKGDNGVLGAMRHNKRTLPNDNAHIDATRTPLNYSLLSDSPPEAIARYAKSQMILAGIEKPRKDQVRAVEIIYSLPIDQHQQDTRQFFIDCFKWTKQTFSGDLLAFDVHLDESAPHAHAVILPLIDGRMLGHDMVGNTGNLMRLINKFHADVANIYGFSRNKRRQFSSIEKQNVEILVLSHLKSDPVMLSSVWSCIRDAIRNDPIPFAQLLSIKTPPVKLNKSKSFVAIMTSKGKGKKAIAFIA